MSTYENADCRACNGSGVSPNWPDKACKECDGWGRVHRVAMKVESAYYFSRKV